jgi:hypothetical protein
MSKFTSMIRKGLLAAALAGSAFGASAAPTTYHVDLNTTSITGGTYLDFAFSSAAGAALSNLTVSNLLGGPVTLDGFDGSATTAGATGFSMSNDANGLNYVDYIGNIASIFSFDVTFADGFESGPAGLGSLFYISILGSDFNPVTNGNAFAQFALSSDAGIRASFAPGTGSATLVDANAVPEPTQLVLMLTALAMMGMMVKRRQG